MLGTSVYWKLWKNVSIKRMTHLTLRGALVCSRTDFSHAACLLNLSRTVIMYRWLLLAINI